MVKLFTHNIIMNLYVCNLFFLAKFAAQMNIDYIFTEI